MPCFVAQARAGKRHGKGFKLAGRGAQAPAVALQKEAARGTRYPLAASLTLAVLAKLTAANQVRDVAEWATHRQRDWQIETGQAPHVQAVLNNTVVGLFQQPLAGRLCNSHANARLFHTLSTKTLTKSTVSPLVVHA